MATTFAITGIQRNRLKYYRPSYTSDLPPIYEDPVALLRNGIPGGRGGEYVHCPRANRSGNGRFNFAHDYEEIDTDRMDERETTRSVANSSGIGVSMLNGIMNSVSRVKSSQIQANSRTTDNNGNEYSFKTNSMLNGIMKNRFSVENGEIPSCETDSMNFNGKLCNYNGKNENVRDNDPQSVNEQFTRDALPVLEALDKALDLQDPEAAKDLPDALKSERNSISSLYQAKDGYRGDPMQYGAVTDANGVVIKRWPKLEPEPPHRKYLLCPAERKMRRRCFVLGFIILVLLIGFLVAGMIEGWMFTKTGKGIDGSADEPLLTMSNDFGMDPGNNTIAKEA